MCSLKLKIENKIENPFCIWLKQQSFQNARLKHLTHETNFLKQNLTQH